MSKNEEHLNGDLEEMQEKTVKTAILVLLVQVTNISRKNTSQESSIFHPKNTLSFNGKLEKNEKF